MVIGRHGFLLAWVAVSAALVTCTACAGVDPDAQTLAENGSDVSDVTARVSGLAASFGLGAGPFDPAAYAATATLYTPGGCATPVETAESVKLTFADCSGPWGLVHVSGSVTVEPPSSGGKGMVIETKDLQLGGATVSFDATWDVASKGSERTLTWSSTLTGTTARGRSFEIESTGMWTLTWQLGGTCIELDGSSQGVVGGSDLDIEVDGLTRCNADCPAAGTISVTSGSLSESISFDGSDVATFTTASHRTDDIQLACGL
jgi:hypothetical protein